MTAKTKGTLIIIGGHEEKEGDCTILHEVAGRARGGSGKLVVVTVATELPEEVGKEYREVFGRLGVDTIEVLDIRTREQAYDDANLQKLADASAVFFTGDDQLRITSQVSDSLLYRCMEELY